MGVTKVLFIGYLKHKGFMCDNVFDCHSNHMGWILIIPMLQMRKLSHRSM